MTDAAINLMDGSSTDYLNGSSSIVNYTLSGGGWVNVGQVPMFTTTSTAYFDMDMGGGGPRFKGLLQKPKPAKIKPFTLPLPNVPPGTSCDAYSDPVLKAICNNAGNNATSNCVRGNLLNLYDPSSGYKPALIPAHCEAWSSCGMPAPLVWGACAL
ncbi:MAG TPA: hypothetical protein VFC29_23700 [Candidatus Limnocylindrales bacterium]|jgi:hypothetical protein|nr:hypothetical protein [Candidatus Limnocylindrales bacterium]